MGKIYHINSGDIFGRLTVVGKVSDAIDPKTRKHMSQYLCRCSCPDKNLVIVKGKNLVSGHTRSCGCLLKENASVLKRGLKAEHPEYPPAKVNANVLYAYYTMIYDAKNGVDNAYCNQIPICGIWSDRDVNNLKSFYNSMSQTYEPGCKLKRLDGNVGFRPDNCYWGSRGYTELEMMNDRFIEFNGYNFTASEWNRALGYPPNTISTRLLNGYTEMEAIFGKANDNQCMNGVYFVDDYGRPLNIDTVEDAKG